MYDFVFSANKERLPLECVRNLIHFRKTGSVLDLGVGNGRNALYLARNGYRVEALDANELTINKIRTYANDTLLSG